MRMSNQDVINFLNQVRKMLLDDKSWLESTIQPINEAFDVAISALQAQEETVSRKVYEQISWERDIAVMQLKDLGYGLGEKIRTDGDTISRQAAIDAIVNWAESHHENPDGDDCIMIILDVPPAQPEPLSDAYMNAVWTWLIDYQIKVAGLKGRYTPYEVLSWVVNDWRKEHERFD